MPSYGRYARRRRTRRPSRRSRRGKSRFKRGRTKRTRNSTGVIVRKKLQTGVSLRIPRPRAFRAALPTMRRVYLPYRSSNSRVDGLASSSDEVYAAAAYFGTDGFTAGITQNVTSVNSFNMNPLDCSYEPTRSDKPLGWADFSPDYANFIVMGLKYRLEVLSINDIPSANTSEPFWVGAIGYQYTEDQLNTALTGETFMYPVDTARTTATAGQMGARIYNVKLFNNSNKDTTRYKSGTISGYLSFDKLTKTKAKDRLGNIGVEGSATSLNTNWGYTGADGSTPTGPTLPVNPTQTGAPTSIPGLAFMTVSAVKGNAAYSFSARWVVEYDVVFFNPVKASVQV